MGIASTAYSTVPRRELLPSENRPYPKRAPALKILVSPVPPLTLCPPSANSSSSFDPCRISGPDCAYIDVARNSASTTIFLCINFSPEFHIECNRNRAQQKRRPLGRRSSITLTFIRQLPRVASDRHRSSNRHAARRHYPRSPPAAGSSGWRRCPRV